MENPAELYKLIQAGGVTATLLIVFCGAAVAGRKGIWEWGSSAARERALLEQQVKMQSDRADRAEADRNQLHKDLQADVIPALVKQNEIAADYQRIIRKMISRAAHNDDE